jgi:hypothetical protein
MTAFDGPNVWPDELSGDPSALTTASLEEHGRRWCELPTVQVGPLKSPDDHPDNDDDDLSWRTW